ncbi:MAG TPA: serine/threonine-protein kinase, partial [Miltoncostaeaceae bacterium]|nr:serine/threonine-protein kinase [Miltoncostaeaceae bacterium]
MSGIIGRTIEGYRIESELGRGGQAVVYRATQIALQRPVALKIVSHQLSADPSFLERFKREGISAASLDHPHVIPVYEAGEADGMAFLAMKFVDGPSLDDLVRSGGGIEARRGLAILRQAAQALDYAHGRGLVHRDVKPANILLGPGDHAYLSDFGLTRAMDGSRLTSSGVWMGTLEYVAPEQIRGSDVTSAADRYALAVVAYEVLTGRPIFDQPDRTALLYAHLHEPPVPASRRRAGLGPEVDAVFARGLSK